VFDTEHFIWFPYVREGEGITEGAGSGSEWVIPTAVLSTKQKEVTVASNLFLFSRQHCRMEPGNALALPHRIPRVGLHLDLEFVGWLGTHQVFNEVVPASAGHVSRVADKPVGGIRENN
jgi:hypothetical protein